MARYTQLARLEKPLPECLFAISVFGQAFRVYKLALTADGPLAVTVYDWKGVLDRPGESQLRDTATLQLRSSLSTIIFLLCPSVKHWPIASPICKQTRRNLRRRSDRYVVPVQCPPFHVFKALVCWTAYTRTYCLRKSVLSACVV